MVYKVVNTKIQHQELLISSQVVRKNFFFFWLPGSQWKGTTHNVILEQLQTSTTYYYIVGSSITNLWSSEYQFNTLFAFNWTKGQALDRPLRFAWFGDMGYTGILILEATLTWRLFASNCRFYTSIQTSRAIRCNFPCWRYCILRLQQWERRQPNYMEWIYARNRTYICNYKLYGLSRSIFLIEKCFWSRQEITTSFFQKLHI